MFAFTSPSLGKQVILTFMKQPDKAKIGKTEAGYEGIFCTTVCTRLSLKLIHIGTVNTLETFLKTVVPGVSHDVTSHYTHSCHWL